MEEVITRHAADTILIQRAISVIGTPMPWRKMNRGFVKKIG